MPHDIDHHAIINRIAATRGGVRSVFDQIDPSRTAHLVVDMQNGFMEEGAPVEVPHARGIVGNINRLSQAMREAGGTNIFLRYTTRDIDDAWSIFGRRLGPQAAGHREGFMAGHHYWQFWPELEIEPGDVLIEKSRFSAFTANASTLHQELQERGIDTLLITGTLTNCCCETNARDAMQLNYRVAMVSDANAALSDEEHAASLFILGLIFADLHTTEETVRMVETAGAPVSA